MGATGESQNKGDTEVKLFMEHPHWAWPSPKHLRSGNPSRVPTLLFPSSMTLDKWLPFRESQFPNSCSKETELAHSWGFWLKNSSCLCSRTCGSTCKIWHPPRRDQVFSWTLNFSPCIFLQDWCTIFSQHRVPGFIFLRLWLVMILTLQLLLNAYCSCLPDHLSSFLDALLSASSPCQEFMVWQELGRPSNPLDSVCIPSQVGLFWFVVVQSLSVWLWDPMDCSPPGFPVLHYL